MGFIVRPKSIIHICTLFALCLLWWLIIDQLTHIFLCLLHLGTDNRNTKQTLQWRHDKHDAVSNHQPHDCLLNRLFRRRSKKTAKLRVTGLFAGNSPVTGEFPAQRTSNAENAFIWWRHHEVRLNRSHVLWDMLKIHTVSRREAKKCPDEAVP